ncbi:MAG: asparagine synthase (glutamine-hydrolyzing) [Pelagibacteraceae bacterium TMED124]|nr:MAG: asparagine synthase (glutamine-hydrolyzing) [Pelagibacteraceae bacterium TMED124]
MCGFFGISSNDLEAISESKFQNQRLYLRGPDANGVKTNSEGTLKVVHHRLSILDLSNLANQPMINETDNSKWIAFNGEIYNHEDLRDKLLKKGVKFKTTSDTEVLLKGLCLEKEKFIEKISGPFAFAFVDEKRKEILIARDSSGEKPLFFNECEYGISFGSDLIQVSKAFCNNPKLSISSAHEYFLYGSPRFPHTIFNNVNQVLPGNYLYISLEKHSIKKESIFFSYERSSFNKNLSNSKYLTSKLKKTLFKSIKQQSTCDREVALLLSGGIDSSIVAAISASTLSKVNTYTVNFRDHNCQQDIINARLISNYFSTNHTEIDIEEANPIFFEKIIKKIDLPITDPSLIPSSLIFENLSRDFTVALSGDGADELFGGYNHYQYLSFIKIFKIILKKLPKLREDFIVKNFSPSLRGRNWLGIPGRNLEKDPLLVRQILLNDEIQNLFLKEFKYQKRINPFTSFFNESIISNALKLDFYDYMSAIVLQKTDRASMLNSVEARSPFLDKEVMDFSLKLEDKMLVDCFSRKKLLNNLADEIIPINIRKLQKKKFGFSFSTNKLFRKKVWYEYALNTFNDAKFPINKKQLIKILEKNLIGENYGQILYSSIMLIKWMNVNDLSFL